MENQTPRIAVAIRYKKAFRQWLKSLPWVNNIPAHRSEEIQSAHLAEALQYRPKLMNG